MYPVVIAAGGTGGHLFPAVALAAELKARGRRVVLFTDARTAERSSAVFGCCDRFVIPGAGVAGRGALRAAGAAMAMLRGAVLARSLLIRLNATALVAFGGYPSVAPVLAAGLSRRRPPIILHEQNAVLGRANRFLARRTDLLALSFPETAGVPAGIATVTVGNPVRATIRALADHPYTPPGATLRLLVLGGSLGARIFSELVPEALAGLAQPLRQRLIVAQQCRAEDLARARETYAAAGIAAELAPFFEDVAERLAQAHLVLARAGASTVAELAAAHRPALLVPLPGAIDDHQRANALALAATGAAWVIDQSGLDAAALRARLAALLTDPAALAHAAIAAPARPDATASLADLVEQRIRREARA
jgi:UDP-N-acetylglucosamine--N-acetylmuramyl-(pentapeptide) pyrophosphoryl-undecaprenol N-acetylglucosamine transferase